MTLTCHAIRYRFDDDERCRYDVTRCFAPMFINDYYVSGERRALRDENDERSTTSRFIYTRCSRMRCVVASTRRHGALSARYGRAQ